MVFKAYGRAQAQIIECANETFSAIRTVRNDFPTADAVVSCQTFLLLLPMRMSFQGGYMWSWPSVLTVCYLSLSYAGGRVVRVNIPSSSFIFKDSFSMERLFTQCLHALCNESSFFLQSHCSISLQVRSFGGERRQTSRFDEEVKTLLSFGLITWRCKEAGGYQHWNMCSFGVVRKLLYCSPATLYWSHWWL